MLPAAMRGTALLLTRAFAAALPAADHDRRWYDRQERRFTGSDPIARRRARSVVGSDRSTDD
jgi:hypothetical protein